MTHTTAESPDPARPKIRVKDPIGRQVTRWNGGWQGATVADRAVRYLAATPSRSMSALRLYRAFASKVPAAEIHAALTRLEAEGKVRSERIGPGPKGGRPKTVWALLTDGGSAR